MKLIKIAALSATLLAGGCATEMAWQRADGYPLDRSFAWAAGHCRERAKEHWGDRAEAMERCMRRYGYVWTAVAVAEPSRHRHHHHNHHDYDDYDD
ncbi:MAG TPA: hypothetical protein VG758_31830 [Hyphomicrobiaceae bacterium]|jgi:hypothetical protein|nr:hypothetical protein [Hyphomicrobiaceae bacterium]